MQGFSSIYITVDIAKVMETSVSILSIVYVHSYDGEIVD